MHLLFFVGIHLVTHRSFPLEYAQLFATLIARTAKDVDVLIDSLPSEESTSALQVLIGGVAFNHRLHSFYVFLKGFTHTEALGAHVAVSQQGEPCEQFSCFLELFY